MKKLLTLLALLLLAAFSPAAFAAPTWTYPGGLNDASFTGGPTDSDYQPHNFLYGAKITIATSKVASKMGVRVSTSGTPGALKFGLYDISGNLLAQSTADTVSSTTMEWVDSGAISVNLAAGSYFVLVSGEVSSIRYNFSTSGDGSYATEVYATAMQESETITDSGDEGQLYAVRLELDDAASAPTLSSATPSGTLGTETTATVGATSTASTGTFYAILSTSNNASGASCTQIKAGQNSTGASATFAEDDTVSTTSPSVGFTDLTAGTLYYYAACHTDTNGDSNVVSGSFTTAAADVVATKLVFGSQPGNVVVGETFGAFTVRAVDDSDALDVDFDGDVTVALETGSGALAGTLTESAVAGIATFDDVHIDTLNVDAVIEATADGLTAANSDEFDVTAGTGTDGTAGFPSSSRLGGLLQ
jgi:hypothetical protein